MAVSRDIHDLRRRLGAITVARSYDGGHPITAEDLGAAGAMTVLLKDALKPNLIQTLEGQPCIMHCGPFANIAHGNNSLVADLIGMKLGDYVVTESGFGSDMGMEKFFDIVCRFGKLTPSAAVLVTTVRAIKHHGGIADDPRDTVQDGNRAIEAGMANVRRHLGIVAEFGIPCVVAVNRRPGDSDEEVELVRRLALDAGAFGAEINEAFEKGGIGAADLATAVVEACEQPNQFDQLYGDETPIRDKIETVAKRIYGARDVFFYPEAEKKIAQFEHDGFGHFPVCMAKTHLSLSADPTVLNAPEDFTLTVRDIRAYTGAGWLVPLCGDITQMPGLGKCPGGAQRRHRRAWAHSRPVLSGPPENLLAERPLRSLLDDVASATPAPGGGSSAGWALRARRRAGRDGRRLCGQAARSRATCGRAWSRSQRVPDRCASAPPSWRSASCTLTSRCSPRCSWRRPTPTGPAATRRSAVGGRRVAAGAGPRLRRGDRTCARGIPQPALRIYAETRSRAC